MAETVSADVIGKLREAVTGLKGTPIHKEIFETRDAVLARFQPVFSPENVSEITAEEFRVGRIDLLAKHRNKPCWLVVELKRNQTSDQTVGQLLRYIGWVKHHLAGDGEPVHGMIICREPDNALRYAVSTLQNVELRRYQVEFHLREPETLLTTSGGDVQ